MNAGTVVDERFEIERPAARGGMGTVYRARDVSSGATVALKLLHGQKLLSDERRFAREGRVLAELDHPAIVRYITHGVSRGGDPYLAMEWLEGQDLGERLARGGALGVAETLSIARQVAAALAVAHARGILHRDIKPQNLFLVNGETERLKVVDFGVAKVGTETRSITRTDVFVGTPAYASPEQVRGEKLSARTDVFSLGCVLFECLAGRPPFSGDHMMAILAKILFEEPPHLCDVCDDVPQALGDLVARMLSKEPSGRPENASSLVEELSALHPGLPRGRAREEAPSLTTGEQRLVSVILASAGTSAGADPEHTLPAEDVTAPFERLREVAAALASHVECLADGVAIAAFSGKASAADQAAQVARCALSMRAALPEVSIVLATGRGGH